MTGIKARVPAEYASHSNGNDFPPVMRREGGACSQDICDFSLPQAIAITEIICLRG
jgi:hypothetical protein